MTAEVVVRGELEIRKGIDGMNLDDALMMLDGILMQVCCVENDNLSKCMKLGQETKAYFTDVCFPPEFCPLKVTL